MSSARRDLVTLRHDWAPTAAALPERYLATPDFPENTGGEPVPSLWMGETGILLVAHRLAPDRTLEERLLDCVRANTDNPTRELMWGSPGTMLAAHALHERTGDAAWLQAWQASADRLWDAWTESVWEQDLYGRAVHYLGPAHGFAGIVHALSHGSHLDAARRATLDRRVATVAAELAEREGDLAQWAPTLEPPSDARAGRRTQWCHGAPGMVASLAAIAPGDDALTELLVAGGELTWTAGPLAKGPGLCHGTAGNGYALLKLFERTQDERWLDQARAFAMHAQAQVERERRHHGQGRHTLWTGDPGTAIFLADCLDATAGLPLLDAF